MEMALAYYSVVIRRIHGPYLRGRCPLPTHRSRSSAPSFIVNTQKNAWICHSSSCGGTPAGHAGGNVLDFVAAMENCSLRKAAIKLQERFSVITSLGAQRATLIRSIEPRSPMVRSSSTPPLGCDSNKPLAFTLTNIDHTHPYLDSRGIDRETVMQFGIGFYRGAGLMQQRIVIPVHDENGALVAYAGRALEGSAMRYRFPRSFRKSLVLYNLHRAIGYGRAVVIVEGFFDCFKLHQAELPCVVALMGSSLSTYQEALLQEHFCEATLMLDGDIAGRNATEKIASQLRSKLAVKVIEVPTGNQPDQLSTGQLRCLCGLS
jgi:DNA primase